MSQPTTRTVEIQPIYPWFITATLFVVAVLIDAFILRFLWKWFIIHVFQTPPLSYALSIGVVLTAALIVGTRPTIEKDLTIPYYLYTFVSHILFSLLIWGFAYVVYNVS